MTQKFPPFFPGHRWKGNCRPTEVLGEVVVDEGTEPLLILLVPQVVHDAAHLFLRGKQANHRAMVLLPVLDVRVLAKLSHELCDGMTALRNPLALRQLWTN